MFTNGYYAEGLLQRQPKLERKSLFDTNGFHSQITGGWGKYGYEIPTGKYKDGAKVSFTSRDCYFDKFNENWNNSVFVFGTQKLIDFSGYRYLVVKIRGTSEVSDAAVVLTDDKDLTTQDQSAARYYIITTGSVQSYVIDLAKDGLSGKSKFIALTAGLSGWDITTREFFEYSEVYLTNINPNTKTVWLYKKGVEGSESGGWGNDNWTITTPGHLGSNESGRLKLEAYDDGTGWVNRRAYICTQALIKNEFSNLGISFKVTKNGETYASIDVQVFAERDDYPDGDMITAQILSNKYREAMPEFVTEIIPIPFDSEYITIKITLETASETPDVLEVNGVWLE